MQISGIKSLVRPLVPRKLWDRLRLARVRASEKLFRPYWARHSFVGIPLEVYIADPVAREWYDHDIGNWDEIIRLENGCLNSGARVFNLGAHHAVVAAMLAAKVGPSGQVIAVEAGRRNTEVARMNLERNDIKNVELLLAAAAAENGKVHFNENFNGQVDDGAGALGKVEVEAISIDELTRRYGTPDLITIDIEGYECEALRGCEETFKARPDFFIEVHSQEDLSRFGGSVQRVMSYFQGKGYDLLACGTPEFEPHAVTLPLSASEIIARTQQPFSLIATYRGV